MINKQNLVITFLVFLTIGLLTFLRTGLVIIYPIIILALIGVLSLRISWRVLLLLLISIGTIPLSFIINNQPILFNTFFSLYIIFPLLILLLTSTTAETKRSRQEYYKVFFKFIVVMMVINNLIGMVQYIIYRNDDAFIGLYGTHGIGAHGLGIINGIMFLYYLIKFKNLPRWSTLPFLLFFLVSFILSFFGLALVLMVCSFFLFYFLFQFRLTRIIKIIPLIFLTAGILYFSSAKTFNYNYNIMEKTFETLSTGDFSEEGEMPRKLTLYYNYLAIFSNDIKYFLFGVGPGTFNSRVSFLLNGIYSQNMLVKLIGDRESALASEYVFPLWDNEILSVRFSDGTRNQPFSSIIALLAEYGFIFTFGLFILILGKLKSIIRKLNSHLKEESSYFRLKELIIKKEFLIISGIFIFLMSLTGNLFEHTEILLYIVIIKLMELSINKKTLDIKPLYTN